MSTATASPPADQQITEGVTPTPDTPQDKPVDQSPEVTPTLPVPPTQGLEIKKDPVKEDTKSGFPILKNDGKMPKGIWIKKKGEVQVTIYVYKKPEGEEVEGVMMNQLSKDAQESAGVVEIPITARLSIPNRKQLQRYRERSGRWVEEASSLLTDKYQMRQWLLKYHLLDIDIPDPETGVKIKLTKDKDGKLTQESETFLDDLHPSIIDIMMSKFERTADLLY